MTFYLWALILKVFALNVIGEYIKNTLVHKIVVHKLVYFVFYVYICSRKDIFDMEKAFVYGMSVEGDNFTDRVNETKRLKMDFENGINVILVSPRRIGKSSIVRKVMKEITDPKIKIVFIDIYDCRSVPISREKSRKVTFFSQS